VEKEAYIFADSVDSKLNFVSFSGSMHMKRERRKKEYQSEDRVRNRRRGKENT
jgi:hypothetical protein